MTIEPPGRNHESTERGFRNYDQQLHECTDPAFEAPDISDYARKVAERSIELWRSARRLASDIRSKKPPQTAH